jgi:hypothetical protein
LRRPRALARFTIRLAALATFSRRRRDGRLDSIAPFMARFLLPLWQHEAIVAKAASASP